MHKRSSETVRDADIRPETLADLQSSLPINRRSRPPTIGMYGAVEGDRRIPLRKDLQKRSSKFGLHGMFNRTKASRLTVDIVSPVLGEPVPEESPDFLIFQNPRPAPSPVTPKTKSSLQPAAKPSLLNMGSKSATQNTPIAKPSPKVKHPNKTDTRTSTAWVPPPLFQAYPQSIKHATLSATTLSADAIIRLNNQSKRVSVVDELTHTPIKKADRATMKHRSHLSGSISKAYWTQKIFILVTSGYLLQYAGSGSFDRLPEKMVQLGKDSVAFASDVIPGKHWVLQISQSMDVDGTSTSDSRSLLSRFAFRGTDFRRNATSLLLILDSAEDLDSWIAVMRREIESLGGKKAVTEIGTPKVEKIVPDLKSQPSHRYLVRRELDPILTASSSPCSVSVPSWTNEHLNPEKLVDAVMSEPHSPFIRPSTGHHSMTTISSHEGHHLDSLRDSSNRLSYMSSSQRTYPTSRSTSPANSPTRDSFSTIDDYPRRLPSQEDVRPRPNALAINERRRSMQIMQNPVLDSSVKYRPHSTYDTPSLKAHQYSPTPNFSLPNSSSRRYSFAKTSAMVSNSKTNAKDDSSAPNVLATLPLRSRESSTAKGARKPPLSAHNSSTRPLSPVKDTVSPHEAAQASYAATSNRPASGTFAQKRTSVINNPCEPPALRPLSSANTGRRISAHLPKNSSAKPDTYFQPPRRLSSMQALYKDQEAAANRNSATYLSAAALTTPLPQLPSPLGADYVPQQQDLASIYNGTSMESEFASASPETTKAKASCDLRRPASLAFSRSERETLSQLKNMSSNMPAKKTLSSETAPTVKPPSNTVRRLRIQSTPQALSNRRSLPALTDGPPPAPPPNCALPPLPSPAEVGVPRASMRHSIKA
ncbi:hypothetical protein BP6252_04415 [Coleophoma cylindrospora]|uniref:PH domain-containing protein n=1 Tax=Coleophoma cylindrospora TaxID=1849047 RepID=A0A3D8S0F0_9HELO|nr:hypothetical protein BP6252_04415 [Coleophoma cylindrospora]